MIFSSELEMSLLFKEYLEEKYQQKESVYIIEEFKSPFGIPDYMIFEYEGSTINTIISFELKLSSWKRGLSQAFKYKSFSNISFLILDEAKKNLITKYISNFTKTNIGLGVFNKNKEIEILYFPRIENPYSNLNRTKVLKKIEDDNIIINFNADKSYTSMLYNKQLQLSTF